MITKTDKDYMVLAERIAAKSPNLGRKTSSVFVNTKGKVIVYGCNTFPPGIHKKEERLQKPACYIYIEHAERIAIGKAAAMGTSLFGSTVYLPWFPCSDCARMLVCTGVSRMVCVEPDWNDPMYNFQDSLTILTESGITIEYITN
jgi:dCMP deaminase